MSFSAFTFICTICIVCICRRLTIILQLLFHDLLRNHKKRLRCLNVSTVALPPGPWRLPFLGNLHQLLMCKPLLPHQALAQFAKKHGPLMCLHLGSRLALFISSGVMAKAFLSAHDRNFASRPALAFCDHLLYGQQNGVAFNIYGPQWRKMRRICTLELFTKRRIMSFEKIIEEELGWLVGDVSQLCGSSGNGCLELNVAHLAHLMVSNVMGRLVLSKRMCDIFVGGESLLEMFKQTNDAIVPAMADFLPFVGPLLDTKSRRKMKNTHRHIDAFWTTILEDRRKHREAQPQSLPMDFLDVLLSNEEVRELGDENIKATLMDILGAGSETSAITIEWAMAELLTNPHCLVKLQREVDTACPTMELLPVAPSSSSTCPISGSQWAWRNVLGSSSSFPFMGPLPQLQSSVSCHSIAYSQVAEASYLKAVVKETLRLHPPVPLLIPRGSTEGTTCRFGKYTFPANVMLFVNAWAIGRDGEAWQQPDAFEPGRFNCHNSNGGTAWSNAEFEMLPFGAGRRRCPGMPLALCIMELTVATFVRAFHWELRKGRMEDMREKSGSAGTHKAEALVAVVRPRWGMQKACRD